MLTVSDGQVVFCCLRSIAAHRPRDHFRIPDRQTDRRMDRQMPDVTSSFVPGGGLRRECVLRIPSVSLKATKLGGFSEEPCKKVGPVSVLGRARSKTLRNVFGVESPTVGPTSSSVRLYIYVPSHIKLQAVPNDVPYI